MFYQQIGSLRMSANSISSNRPVNHASVPMGQANDQAIIASMKRGNGRPMRLASATLATLVMPQVFAATA